jgi:hypothetical protein
MAPRRGSEAYPAKHNDRQAVADKIEVTTPRPRVSVPP